MYEFTKIYDRNLDKKIRIIKNISNTKKYMIKNEVFILTSTMKD